MNAKGWRELELRELELIDAFAETLGHGALFQARELVENREYGEAAELLAYLLLEEPRLGTPEIRRELRSLADDMALPDTFPRAALEAGN